MPERALDVVLRSEARLLRSVEGFPFPGMADEAQRAELLDRVAFAADGGRFTLLPLDELSPQRKALMVEDRLLPAKAIQKENGQMAVVLDRKRLVSVWVNGDDPLCFSAVLPGLDAGAALDRVLEAESLFARRIRFAFDRQFGYLTSSLSDAGTGLRVTVALHLPCLERTGRVTEALGALKGRVASAKLPLGSVYLLFNSASIGMTEAEIALTVTAAAHDMIVCERQARENALMTEPDDAALALARLRQTLEGAQSLTEKDCMLHWSCLRRGITAGALRRSLVEVDALLPASSPGHLDAAAARVLSPDERGEKRADLFRDFIRGSDPGEGV